MNKSQKSQMRNFERGYTLVEVVIALTILMTVLTPIMLAFMLTNRNAYEAKMKMEVHNLAVTSMEKLKADPDFLALEYGKSEFTDYLVQGDHLSTYRIGRSDVSTPNGGMYDFQINALGTSIAKDLEFTLMPPLLNFQVLDPWASSSLNLNESGLPISYMLALSVESDLFRYELSGGSSHLLGFFQASNPANVVIDAQQISSPYEFLLQLDIDAWTSISSETEARPVHLYVKGDANQRVTITSASSQRFRVFSVSDDEKNFVESLYTIEVNVENVQGEILETFVSHANK